MKRDPNLLQISRPTHLIIDGHLNAHYQCHIVVSKRVFVLSLPRRIPQKMHKALGMLGIWLLNVPKIDPIFHVPPPSSPPPAPPTRREVRCRAAHESQAAQVWVGGQQSHTIFIISSSIINVVITQVPNYWQEMKNLESATAMTRE